MEFATKQVSLGDYKGFQGRGNASQNAYKHNAFLMILSAFLPNGLQNDQETTGFIRVRVLGFAVCEIASFPKGFK